MFVTTVVNFPPPEDIGSACKRKCESARAPATGARAVWGRRPESERLIAMLFRLLGADVTLLLEDALLDSLKDMSINLGVHS